MSSKASSKSEIVRLNVGGCHFTTTRSTLTSDPDSVLARMFADPNPAMLDEDGRYFIDRDGGAFEVLLGYLRTHQLLDFGVSKDRVKVEADYFGLDGLVEALSQQQIKVITKRVFVVGFGDTFRIYVVEPGKAFESGWQGREGVRDISGKIWRSTIPYDNLQETNVFFIASRDISLIDRFKIVRNIVGIDQCMPKV